MRLNLLRLAAAQERDTAHVEGQLELILQHHLSESNLSRRRNFARL